MKKVFLFFCTLLLTTALTAQTLEECRRLARERYPEIRRYDLIRRMAEYDLQNASRAWLPQVALSAQATYQSATPTYPEALSNLMAAHGMELTGIRKDQYRVAVDINQNIWDGGENKARRGIIAAEANAQTKATDVSLHELQSRVDNMYFSILLLEEAEARTQVQIELLDSYVQRLKNCIRSGVAKQADADAVEAEKLTAGQQLKRIRASREAYRRMLEIVIGRSLTDYPLQRPPLPSLKNKMVLRPELQWMDARSSALQAQQRAVEASVMPKLSAFAQGYYGYPGLDMFRSMTSAEWTLNALVGVRLSWNISALYGKRNKLRSIEAESELMDVQRDVFLFNTSLETTQQEGEIERLKQTIEEDFRIVELRRSVRLAAESELENGTIDATDLLQKVTEETQASLNRSCHEIELLQAVYRLKHTLNQ